MRPRAFLDNLVLNSSGPIIGARNSALSRNCAHKSASTLCAGQATGYHDGEVLGERKNRRPDRGLEFACNAAEWIKAPVLKFSLTSFRSVLCCGE